MPPLRRLVDADFRVGCLVDDTLLPMKALLILTLFLSNLSLVNLVNAKEFCSTKFQETQSQDIAQFLNRWKNQKNRDLFESALWTLVHDYSNSERQEEVLKNVETFFAALGKHEKGDGGPIEKMGGPKAFKDKLSGWLDDDDQAVRAFAAVMIGISGDKSYAPKLVNLLKREKYKDGDRLHYDRGRAAMALGLIDAKEYSSNLVTLLNSSNKYDRAGAAYGLGFIKTKDQAKAVAKLLNDEDENVRQAAMESLDMMGASELIKDKKTRTP